MPDNQTVSHSQSIFDQTNDFNFLALVQSRIEYFSLRTYKISEQQVNPKCCQSPILAIIVKISKMANIVYRQMPAPRELLQQIPAKAPGWGKFLVQIPRGARGGWLWMKLIPPLNY